MTVIDLAPRTAPPLAEQLAQTTRNLLDRAKIEASVVIMDCGTPSLDWIHVTVRDDSTLALTTQVIATRAAWEMKAIGDAVVGTWYGKGAITSVVAKPATYGSQIGVGDIVALTASARHRSPVWVDRVGREVRVREVDPVSGHFVTVFDEFEDGEWQVHERDLTQLAEGTVEDALSSVSPCAVCGDAPMTLGESDGRCTSCREQGLVPA